MNKLCYRVIFNKARGLLMVVSELAKSASGSGRKKVTTPGLNSANVRFKLGRLSLLTYLALGMVQLAGATIIADQAADKSLQPSVINTANGLPQVDIQTPTAGGVSRNHYSQFDVTEKGAILNNSRKDTNTTIAGYVSGNPYLARGEASVILNEVNSHKESQLHGVIEVAGKQAHVIIANPSGINCSGCGFINANKTTMTTGQVLLEQGQIKGYQIERGTIRITGKGLDTSSSDKTELLARAIEVNAGIWANDLKVVSGQNQIDSQIDTITARPDNAASVTGIAIDVSELGGMYANHINLIGTEKGLGVNNAGEIGAQIGQLVISAEGKLTNSGRLQAKDQMTVNVNGDLSNQGVIASQQQLRLNSDKKITNQNIIYSQQAVNIQAKDLANSKHIESEKADMQLNIAGAVNNDGTIKSGKQLTVTAKAELKNTDYIIAQDEIQLTADILNNHGTIANDNGDLNITVKQTIDSDNLSSGGKIALQAGDSIVSYKTLVAKQRVEIQAESLTNKGKLGSQDGDSQIRLAKQLDNQGLISSGKDLTIHSRTHLNSREQSHLFAKDNMHLNADSIDNKGSIYTEQGDLLLTAQGAVNSRNISSGANLKLTAGDELNTERQLLAKGELNIEAASINNRGSLGSELANVNILSAGNIDSQLISGGKNVNLKAEGELISRQGLYAADNLTVKAQHLTNLAEVGSVKGDSQIESHGGIDNQGLISSAKDLILNTAGVLTNAADKTLSAKNSLMLTARAVDSQGRIQAQDGDLSLWAKQWLNTRVMTSGGNTTLEAGGELNSQQLLLSQGRLDIHAGAITNKGTLASQSQDIQLISDGNVDSDLISAGGAINLKAGGDVASQKGLYAGRGLKIDAASLTNLAELGSQQGESDIQLRGNLANQGLISSSKGLTVNAGGIVTNAKGSGLFAESTLALTAKALDNQGSIGSQSGDLSLRAEQWVKNHILTAGGQLSLKAGGTFESSVLLAATQQLTVDAAGITNHGSLGSNQAGVNLTSDGDIDSKLISAGADLSLKAKGQVTNRQGLYAGGGLAMTAGSLSNTGELGSEAGDSTIRLSGSLDNQGLMSSGNALLIDSAGVLNNAATKTVSAKQGMTINAQVLNNSGIMTSEQGDLALTIKDTAVSHTLNSGGRLQFSAGGQVTSDERMVAKDDMTINTASLINKGVLGSQQGNVNLYSAGQIDSQFISAAKILTLEAKGDVLNRQGLYANDELTITAVGLTNQGELGSGHGNSQLKLTSALDNQGLLSSGKDLTLDSTGIISNTREGRLIAKQNLSISAQALDNLGHIGSEAGDLSLLVRQWVKSQSISSGAKLNLNAGQALVSEKRLVAKGDLTVESAGITNRGALGSEAAHVKINSDGGVDSQLMSAGGDLRLLARGHVINRQGLYATGALSIEAGGLTNLAESGSQQDNSDIRLSGALDNQGLISAAKDLTITSGDKVSSKQLAAGNNLTLSAQGKLENNQSLYAKQHLSIEAAALSNLGELGSEQGNSHLALTGAVENQGLISSGRDLCLTVDGLANHHDGIVSAKGRAGIEAGSVNNQGRISAQQGDLLLTVRDSVDSHTLTSGGKLTLRAGGEVNSRQLLVAGGQLDIEGAAINNQGSLGSESADVNLTSQGAINSHIISAGGNLSLDAQGDVVNHQALYGSNQLTLKANGLTNQGELGSGKGDSALTLKGALDNQGLISSGGQLNIRTVGDFNNAADRQIDAKLGMHIAAGKINNQGSITNQHGTMVINSQADLNNNVLSSGGTLSVTTAEKLQNHNLIVANQGIVLSTQALLNDGKINSQLGDINLVSEGVVDSHTISGGKNVTITAQGNVINHNLLLAEKDLTIKSQADIINHQQLGSQAADVALTAAGKMDNAQLISSAKNLSLQAGQQINNQNTIYAGHNIIVEALALNNHNMMAKNGDITINASQGISSQKIQTEGNLNLHSQGDITNHNLMYAKQSMAISGKNLLSQGDLLSGKSLTINMQQGIDSNRLYAGEDATLNAITRLINRHQLSANRHLSLSSDDLVNHNTIATENGDLSIRLQQDFIHNADSGILSSGRDLKLSSSKNIENHQTLYAKGSLTLDGQAISNFGDLLAEEAVRITGLNGVINQQRIISGGNIKIASESDLINANLISASGNGDLSANNINNQGEIRTQSGLLKMEAKGHIDNAGLLISGQDLLLQAGQNITNRKTVYANGNMLIDAGQQLVNQAELGSTGHLEIKAHEMDNHKGALVLAGVNDKFIYQSAKGIKANIIQNLTNRGTFDAATLNLTAAVINNIATGTLFGDVIAIKTDYLNNQSEAVDKATIAARETLLIGAGKLDNRNHSLLYSHGDLHIGGDLNEQWQVTGRIAELNNHSAKIEALGHLTLQAEQLRNINDNIKLEMRQVSRQKIKEYQLEGSPIRMSADQVQDHGRGISTPYGYSERFTRFTFNRVIKETAVTHSEPGQIIAGQHLQVNAQTLRNENSQLIAGVKLQVEADKKEYINIQGRREINDIGRAKSHWSYTKRDWKRKKKKRYDSSSSAYTPASVEQSFNHDLVRQEVGSVDIQAPVLNPGEVNVNTQGQNAAYQQPTLQNQVTSPSSVVATSLDSQPTTVVNSQPVITQPTGGFDYNSNHGGLTEAAFIAVNGTGVKTDVVVDSTVNLPALAESAHQPGVVKAVVNVSAEVDKITATVIESGQPDVKLTRPSTDNHSPSDSSSFTMAYTALPALTMPGNQLFILNQQPQHNYLIETNPRFTQHRQWLGSEYMLQRLNQDPSKTIKRIGDGYYEQQQVRQQLIASLGQRYLADFHDDSEQYKALLNNGVEYVESFNLKLGIGLNEQQMQQLTKPMVLLVERTLILTDGQQTSGLYPQLYLPAGLAQITATGGLIAGREVYIKVKEDFINQGNIQGADKVGLIAANIIQRHGTTVGGQISLRAEKDIALIGAEIYAKNGLQLSADGDISLASQTSTNQNFMSNHELISRETILNNQQGDLRLKGKNIELKGASLVNQDKNGTLALEGDRVQLTGVKTHIKQDIIFNKDNYLKQKESEEVGSKLLSQGNVLITSQGDTLIKGSEINAGKILAVQAKGSLDIEAGEKTLDFEQRSKITNKGTFSRKTTITQHNINEQRAISSQLNGENIILAAGDSVTTTAGQIISDKDLAITAGQNIDITAAKELMDEVKISQTTKSGLMKGGNLGISFGKVSENRKTIEESRLHKGSVVGSLGGNVKIEAGDKVTVHASDVIAKESLALTGSDVSLTAGDNVYKEKEHYVRQQSGLTIGIGGTAAELYSAAQSMYEGMRESDGRVAALKNVKGVLEALEAMQNMELANDKAQKGASISINISVGGQKTERESHGEYHSVAGSSVSAQQDVTITAREGNILVQGSEVQGGGTTRLEAAQDINVVGAVNTRHNDSKTTTMGGQVGIGIGIGSKDYGLRYKGSANFSQERENMDGSAWTESLLEGRDKLIVKAGRDTSVIGGELKGNRVELMTGNNLTIRSLQDTDDYDYKKLSGAIEGSFGTGFDASLSLSKTDIKSCCGLIMQDTI